MSLSKSSKMINYINYRMRVTIQDGRQLVGKFMAFDRHMNLVLGDCEEFRRLPPKKGSKPNEDREDRRTLGLVLLRGEDVISMTVEGPPPQEETRGKGGAVAPPGPGMGRAAGRGMPAAPLMTQAQPGLSGPARGVGGPAPGLMQPRPPVAQVSAGPVNYPPQPRPPMVVRPGMLPPNQMAPPQFRPGMPPTMAPPQVAGGAPFGQRPPPPQMMRPGGPPPPPAGMGAPRPMVPQPVNGARPPPVFGARPPMPPQQQQPPQQ